MPSGGIRWITMRVFGIADVITADGDLRTFSHFLSDQGGMDGFFAARLRKTS